MYTHSHLESIILRAYDIIGRETPIKADCGKLCGAACCKDAEPGAAVGCPAVDVAGASDASTASNERSDAEDIANATTAAPPLDRPDSLGMLLFPGEIGLLSQEPGFRLYKIPFMDGKAWFLVCEGVCDRRMRPLACRIFPLAPRISADGTVTARPDPRAMPVCPLAGGEFLAPSFRRAVAKTFRMLAREPQIYDFMSKLSSNLDDFNGLIKLFS